MKKIIFSIAFLFLFHSLSFGQGRKNYAQIENDLQLADADRSRLILERDKALGERDQARREREQARRDQQNAVLVYRGRVDSIIRHYETKIDSIVRHYEAVIANLTKINNQMLENLNDAEEAYFKENSYVKYIDENTVLIDIKAFIFKQNKTQDTYYGNLKIRDESGVIKKTIPLEIQAGDLPSELKIIKDAAAGSKDTNKRNIDYISFRQEFDTGELAITQNFKYSICIARVKDSGHCAKQINKEKLR